MKIKNIFKKENKTVAKANVEKIEKNQLEKVIGGADGDRISMNVTVPKQTQGATFGEKVSSGLQSGGGALAQGAS